MYIRRTHIFRISNRFSQFRNLYNILQFFVRTNPNLSIVLVHGFLLAILDTHRSIANGNKNSYLEIFSPIVSLYKTQAFIPIKFKISKNIWRNEDLQDLDFVPYHSSVIRYTFVTFFDFYRFLRYPSLRSFHIPRTVPSASTNNKLSKRNRIFFLNKKIHLLYNQNFMPNFSGLFDRIYRINLHLVFDRKQPLINGHSRWFLLEFVLFYRCYYYFQLSSDFEIAFSLRRLYIFKRLDKILLSTDRGRQDKLQISFRKKKKKKKLEVRIFQQKVIKFDRYTITFKYV